MKTQENRLLRIYLGESDHVDGRPLFEVIVERARDHGMAGATVLRGPLGYGRSTRLHTAKILRLSEDLPLVIEIIDEPLKIEQFVDSAADLLHNVLVTVEKVQRVHSTRPGH